MREIKVFFVCILVCFALCSLQTTPLLAQDGLSAEELAKANNPLANMTALNLQNYYRPTLYGVPDEVSNTFWMRFATTAGKWLIRISLPISTVPPNDSSNTSGLGDIDAFAAYTFIQTPKNTVGIGPLLVAPTAGHDALGTGKWQLGGALVAFSSFNKTVQGGGLITYQASVGGDDDRDDTAVLAIQPFFFFQMGGGTYLRSAPVAAFDLKNDRYVIPFGLGIGKVLKSEKIVFNIFLEPQYTLFHRGVGQPSLQFLVGLNMQFM